VILLRPFHLVPSALFVFLLISGVAACGKKGPPVAPVRIVPAEAGDLAARRIGEHMHLQLRVPDRNTDGSRPADLARIHVYGLTGRAGALIEGMLDHRDFVRQATLVETIQVQAPLPERPDEVGAGEGQAPVLPGVPQGALTAFLEPVTPEMLQEVADSSRAPGADAESQAPAADVLGLRWLFGDGPRLVRAYVAVGETRRGREGRPSRRLQVPLVPPPAALAAPAVTYTEQTMTIGWDAGVDPRRPFQAPASPDVLPAKSLVAGVEPVRFNVYEVATEGANDTVMPQPLNPEPLSEPSFEDPRVAFGVERCYAVRAVETRGEIGIESAASPPACVTPVDTFPPAAPAGLAAVASEGVISLIWEPNQEPDFAGYLVLRGEAPGEKLQALTAQPIQETTYRDTSVAPGVRYVYAIVAIDRAGNLSVQSERAEELAR
jgi:hypothetical protein